MDVKSLRISVLFPLVILQFTAQNFFKSREIVCVQLIQFIHGYPLICGDFIKDLAPLWMSKAHAYQLCFAWSSSNLLLKRLLRPRDSFHIFHTDNNGWKLDTQSILTSATSFQSPFFVHTFQYNLNAEPSTISSALPSRPLRSSGLCCFQHCIFLDTILAPLITRVWILTFQLYSNHHSSCTPFNTL